MSGRNPWICVALILYMGVEGSAMDLKGPPTATHEPLQVSLGVEYSYSEDNVRFTDHGTIALDRLKNVRRNTFTGKFGVGLLDFLELFFRVGAGTLEAKDIDFDGSTDFLRGAGCKVTFYRGERVDLGALFQWSIFDAEETGFVDASGLNAWTKIDVDEQHLAVGATVRMDGWRLYGGPFYYVFDGDVTIKEIGNPRNQVRPDVEEKSEYGGYIGGLFDLGSAGYLNVEYSLTGEAWSVGTGFTWKF